MINSVIPSIKEKLEKSKGLLAFASKTSVFVFSVSFVGLLLLAGLIKLDIILKAQAAIGVKIFEDSPYIKSTTKQGEYVGSNTGKSYYFPWCGAVNRIKIPNLVWFADRASAEAKGYKPASNCHGLK